MYVGANEMICTCRHLYRCLLFRYVGRFFFCNGLFFMYVGANGNGTQRWWRRNVRCVRDTKRERGRDRKGLRGRRRDGGREGESEHA